MTSTMTSTPVTCTPLKFKLQPLDPYGQGMEVIMIQGKPHKPSWEQEGMMH